LICLRTASSAASMSSIGLGLFSSASTSDRHCTPGRTTSNSGVIHGPPYDYLAACVSIRVDSVRAWARLHFAPNARRPERETSPPNLPGRAVDMPTLLRLARSKPMDAAARPGEFARIF
jgi:hypothetical protein